MIPSPILCLPLLLPAADSIEDLYARFGGGFSSTSSEDFQSPETLQESGDEGVLKQLLLTFDPSIDFEGHSIHFALGEKLTDQFSFEWEVQSLNMDLDSFNPQSNGFSVDGRSGLFYNFLIPLLLIRITRLHLFIRLARHLEHSKLWLLPQTFTLSTISQAVLLVFMVG